MLLVILGDNTTHAKKVVLVSMNYIFSVTYNKRSILNITISPLQGCRSYSGFVPDLQAVRETDETAGQETHSPRAKIRQPQARIRSM